MQTKEAAEAKNEADEKFLRKVRRQKVFDHGSLLYMRCDITKWVTEFAHKSV